MSISVCSRRSRACRPRMPRANACAVRPKQSPKSEQFARGRSPTAKRGTPVRSTRRRNDRVHATSPRMNDVLDQLGARWHSSVVLKRDVFSTIERGRFRTDAGEVEAVLRRLDEVPWWSRPLAYELFRRERKALPRAKPLGVAPPLLFTGRRALVRGWIDAVPLHIAKPHGDAGYFRSAKAALRALHRAGIAHNDLAKE